MKIVSFNKPVLFVKYLVYIALTFGIAGTVGHKWGTLSIKLLQVLHCPKKKKSRAWSWRKKKECVAHARNACICE